MQLKILYVIGSLERGGAELHLLNILSGINKEKFRVTVFPLKRGGSIEKEYIKNGIEVIGPVYTSSRIIHLFKILVELIKAMRKLDPDITHFFLPEAYIIGAICSLCSGRSKRIMSRRSLSDYQKKYILMHNIERVLHKYIDFILGNSKAVIEELKKEGIRNEKLGLIYNGVNVPKDNINDVRKSFRKKLNIKEQQLVMVCVANLIPYKGHIDLVTALSQVKDMLPSGWVLYLLGRDDGCGVSINDLLTEYGLEENVFLKGECNNVRKYLSASDIAIICSHQEGFSNSLLEYMAYGLPIIATDVGGNREAITDEITGFIVPSKDINTLANKIADLSNNEELRKKIGANAHREVLKKFSMDKCIETYEQLYTAIAQAENLMKVPINIRIN
jgi:glycosyltransferase involved in cell wall biosynthesis